MSIETPSSAGPIRARPVLGRAGDPQPPGVLERRLAPLGVAAGKAAVAGAHLRLQQEGAVGGTVRTGASRRVAPNGARRGTRLPPRIPALLRQLTDPLPGL